MKNLEVVLVRAENPVNVGQAARAMKNFEVSKLRLVRCVNHTTEKSLTPGWKARAILKKAVCYKNLDSAIKKASFSVGFTARTGKYRGQVRSFPKMLSEILEHLREGKVQFVFGNEKNGLSNEELNKCHAAAFIPASKDYSSLNLSHAVVTSLSAVYSALPSENSAAEKPDSFYPRPGEFDAFLKELKITLELLGYQNKGGSKLLSRVEENFKNFFRRSGLDRKELHLFQSLIARARQRLK